MLPTAGLVDGEEVVQLYVSYNGSSITRPIRDLRGFERVMIKSGETKTITFTLKPGDLAYYDEQAGEYMTERCGYTLSVGPSSDAKSLKSVSIRME